jgi:hypothetical protein
MVQEMHYNTVNLVLTSWESLRRIKNFEEVAGVKLFQRYVNLEIRPRILEADPLRIFHNDAS